MDVVVIGLFGIYYVGIRFIIEILEWEVVGELFGISFVFWRIGFGFGIRFGCLEEIFFNVFSFLFIW